MVRGWDSEEELTHLAWAQHKSGRRKYSIIARLQSMYTMYRGDDR